jgi:hypothetical protein
VRLVTWIGATGQEQGRKGRNEELAEEAGRRCSALLAAARQQGVWTEDISLASVRRMLKGGGEAGEGGKGEEDKVAAASKGGRKRGRAEEARGFGAWRGEVEAAASEVAQEALRHLGGNVKVAGEYLRLLAKRVMAAQGKARRGGEEEGFKGFKGGKCKGLALETLAEEMDAVLDTCGASQGVHALWADRVELMLGLQGAGSDVAELVGLFVRAVRVCSADEAALVLVRGIAAVKEALGHQVQVPNPKPDALYPKPQPPNPV